MVLELLDPTFDEAGTQLVAAPRVATLAGATVGIISNGKRGTVPFFDAIESELLATYGVAEVVRTTKANYSAPAEAELLTKAEQWHALISGLGD